MYFRGPALLGSQRSGGELQRHLPKVAAERHKSHGDPQRHRVAERGAGAHRASHGGATAKCLEETRADARAHEGANPWRGSTDMTMGRMGAVGEPEGLVN